MTPHGAERIVSLDMRRTTAQSWSWSSGYSSRGPMPLVRRRSSWWMKYSIVLASRSTAAGPNTDRVGGPLRTSSTNSSHGFAAYSRRTFSP